MALFKISRGGEKNLPNNITDGWAYFTPDTKGFFIDVNNTINGQSFNERIQINEKPISITNTLKADNWVNKQQTITVDNKITAMWYVLDIELNYSTFASRSAVTKANLSYELVENKIKFSCAGQTPAIDIDITMIFTPKERRILSFNFMRSGNAFDNGQLYYYYDDCSWNEWASHASTLNPRITSVIYNQINSTMLVQMTENKSFIFTASGEKPISTSYSVTSATGFGASEPT